MAYTQQQLQGLSPYLRNLATRDPTTFQQRFSHMLPQQSAAPAPTPAPAAAPGLLAPGMPAPGMTPPSITPPGMSEPPIDPKTGLPPGDFIGDHMYMGPSTKPIDLSNPDQYIRGGWERGGDPGLIEITPGMPAGGPAKMFSDANAGVNTGLLAPQAGMTATGVPLINQGGTLLEGGPAQFGQAAQAAQYTTPTVNLADKASTLAAQRSAGNLTPAQAQTPAAAVLAPRAQPTPASSASAALATQPTQPVSVDLQSLQTPQDFTSALESIRSLPPAQYNQQRNAIVQQQKVVQQQQAQQKYQQQQQAYQQQMQQRQQQMQEAQKKAQKTALISGITGMAGSALGRNLGQQYASNFGVSSGLGGALGGALGNLAGSALGGKKITGQSALASIGGGLLGYGLNSLLGGGSNRQASSSGGGGGWSNLFGLFG